MSDWEIVKRNKKPKETESDWELYDEEKQPKSKESKGFKGIGHEIYENFAEPLRHPLSSAIDAAAGLGSEVYGLGKQAISLPFEALQGKVPRITKNLAQGFENFVNTPANIAGYLGKHGIGFPEDIAERAHIKVNPFEMGEQQAGDITAQGLPSFALLGPLGEAGQLGNIGRASARAGSGAGIGLTQNQNPIATALLNAGIPGAIENFPGFSNKAIAKKLSSDKAAAIEEAGKNYTDLFNKAKEYGVEKIESPRIMAGDIVKHSVPKHHEALIKFLNEPTFENAHWAQSDLGFLKRHLENVAKKQDLTSTQHNTLKNVISAQNRIKQAMFKGKRLQANPEMEQKYNRLGEDYAKNVVPLKGLEDLSDYESKKLKPNNLIKSLLSNDEFMLGIGKKYPQIQINRALRSKPAKWLGSGIAGGIGASLGYEGINKLLK